MKPCLVRHFGGQAQAHWVLLLLCVAVAPSSTASLTICCITNTAATWAVEGAIKPGVNYLQMHELAYRTALTKLKEGGLLV